MSRAFAPVTTLLLLSFALQLSGCYGPPRSVPPASVEDPREARVVAITTVDGEKIEFDDAEYAENRGIAYRKAYAQNDTLYASVGGQPYSIHVDQIHRYWIRTVSSGRTIGLVAGVVGGAFVALVAIAAATKESCPFIYSWNGERWVFDAEPYGGATTRGLERDDFAELENLVPVDGEFRILITNEVPETQHTNQVELVVVDHPRGTRVFADERGGLHTVRALNGPIEARDEGGADLLKWVQSGDWMTWEPLPEPGDEDNRAEITLTFPKPAGARTATLVSRVGTGIWGSYMIKAMLELHGNEVATWYAALDERRSAVDSLLAWNLREELYALQVQVEEPEGWKTRGIMPGGGPFIMEDRALVLDVSSVAGDRLRVRLRPPHGFWAMDAFAVSYEDAEPSIFTQRLRPSMAQDQRGGDVLPALWGPDDIYYSMPGNDDQALVRFDAPPRRDDLERTVFLHSRGWYRIHLDETGTPDRRTLSRIAEIPGAAAQYAAERFSEWRLALGTRSPYTP